MSDHSPTPAPQPTAKNCSCMAWQDQLPLINGPFILAQLRAGRSFDANRMIPWHFCPWCGSSLNATASTSAPLEHNEPCDYCDEVQRVSELLMDFDPTDRFPTISLHLEDLLKRLASRADHSPAAPQEGTTPPTDEIEQRIAEIEARADAASVGPWNRDQTERDEIVVRTDVWSEDADEGVGIVCICDPGDERRFEAVAADAEFIAEARADVPWLIAELRRSRASLERVTEVAENYSAFADTDLAGAVATMDSMIRERAPDADTERLDALAEYIRANGGARLWRSKWEEGVVISVDAHSDEPKATCEEALRASLDNLRESQASITLSQTDSSLRAAEPTTLGADDCTYCLGRGYVGIREMNPEGERFVDCPVCVGSGERVSDKGIMQLRAMRNDLDAFQLEVTDLRSQLAAASSPTVTPPQTPTERESCARVCESRARSLREDGQHGEANEAKKCAAAIRARLDESPLRPIRAASPPVTEEAPNEDTRR